MQPMRAASRLAGLVALVAAACTSPSRSIVATTAPVSVESVVEPSQVVPPPPSEPTLPSTSMLSASPSTIARPDVAGPIEVRMLTDVAANGGRGTHEYSQLQAFSPDGAYVLLAESSAGGYVVKRPRRPGTIGAGHGQLERSPVASGTGRDHRPHRFKRRHCDPAPGHKRGDRENGYGVHLPGPLRAGVRPAVVR